MTTLLPIQLIPEYHQRVWGGQRLKQSHPPIGEAWVIYEQNRVQAGDYAGQPLRAVVAETGDRLLGRRAVARTGGRFPLLIKLLDCADWLSVQVHPNDTQARQLEGPEHFGKTEAWHILAADPGARLISGLRPGTAPAAVAEAIRGGTILDLVQYHPVHEGDTFFMAAGTLHALGPGILLYEVQQTSDLTYRVFDWNRPLTAGRQLHIEKSIAVTNPALTGAPTPMPVVPEGQPASLTACPYFTLVSHSLQTLSIQLDTAGDSFHALTVVEGDVTVNGDGWQHELGRFESLIVPACAGVYTVRPRRPSRLLKASVE